MTKPEIAPDETQLQEAERNAGSQHKRSSSEMKDERLIQIGQALEGFSSRASSPAEIQQIQKQREQDYQLQLHKLEGALGTDLSEESAGMIHQNMVDSTIEQAKKDNERFDDLQRLKKVAETLSPDDFIYFEKILGNQEGRTDQLYDLEGKAMHTTPSSAFKKILESGRIVQDIHNDDTGRDKRGAYLTDADSKEGLTYHTLWDDAKSPAGDKAFSSAKYFDQVKELADHFWSTDEGREKAIAYVKGKRPDHDIRSKDDLTVFFEGMRKGLEIKEGGAAAISLVFEKDELPELSKDGTNELNRNWEQRLYSDSGLDVSKTRTIFVPETKISDIRNMIRGTILEGVEIRPSEELEVIRLLKKIEEK